MIRIEICKKCMSSSWKLIKGIDEKGGHRPFYRFKCNSCNRIIKIKISS